MYSITEFTNRFEDMWVNDEFFEVYDRDGVIQEVQDYKARLNWQN